ncbi:MAG: asparagine synthetase B [Proteobacteria bacterium]|nr:asparagine synthetase B [Pseudomonadota bacterium]
MHRIFGLLRLDDQPADRGAARRLALAMAHGVWTDLRLHCDGPLALGECRRATLAPPPAADASSDPSDREPPDAGLVAAARLDNAEELRARLLDGERANGRLTTDHALLRAAYRRWGPRCPAELLGDFAFALWDPGPRRLVLARDHLGVQPLYYCHLPGRLFAFASELRALLGLREVGGACDERRIGEHLLLDFGATSRTFYRDVQRLPPASTLQLDPGGLHLARYWSLADEPAQSASLSAEEASEGLLRHLRAAVAARVPVRAVGLGSLLSGGLDSSTVTLLAREALDAQGRDLPLPTFSAVFDEVPSCDERPHIARVTGHRPGLASHFVRVDHLAPLGTLYGAPPTPIEPLAAPNTYIIELLYRAVAARGVVGVLLEGPRRRPDPFAWSGSAGGAGRPRSLDPAPAPSARDGEAPALPARARAMGARAAALGATRAALGLPLAHRSCPGPTSAAPRLRPARRARATLGRYGGRGPGGRAVERALHRHGIENGLLTWALELAHALGSPHGLAPLFPLCDLRVLRWCYGLAPAHKLNDGWTRLSLRRALVGVAPPAVAWRPDKSNLGACFLRAFLQHEEPIMREVLAGRDHGLGAYLDLDVARRAFSQYKQAPRWVHARPLWTAATLALWLRSRRGD